MAQVRPSGSAPPSGPDAARLLHEIEGLLGDLHAGGAGRLTWRSDLADVFSLDSLAMAELQDRVEAAFGVRLRSEALARARTPADWLDAVLDARGDSPPTAAVPGAPLERRQRGARWPVTAVTLVESLAWHAEHHPGLVGVRLLDDNGEPAGDLTYGALEDEARTCARALLGEGLCPGDRVALMLPTGREYFVVSMAVMMAGGVPVPIYPPARLSVLEAHLRRQALLLRNAGAGILVTVPEAMLAARLLRSQVPTLRSVRTPAMLATAQPSAEHLPTVHAEDMALIQYTSGSTSDPKGVLLTHRQVLANIRAMGEAAQVDSADVFVSWLPLYHDMGLIGAWHAASLYFGMLLVVMSPLAFLSRPRVWLKAVSDYGGTLSAAPNFAYQSCVDRVSDEDLEGLDLSSWRLTFNGSEPVSAAAVDGFSARFGRCGFRPEAMCPAYGLAEVGVGLCFAPLGSLPRVDTVNLGALAQLGRAVPAGKGTPGSVPLVSCGEPLPGYEVRVVDDHGEPLGEGWQGRVECRGPSATAGYFANEAATTALWDGEWLDTGDAGYLCQGQLLLTGRVKDIVVRAGRNLHPEELEQAIGALEGLDREAVAVFGVRDPARGTESLVVAAETSGTGALGSEDLRAAIAHRSMELLGIAPDHIVFLPPGSVLRTASGKIRRGDTKEAYLAGTLGRPAPSPARQLVRFARSGLVPGLHRLSREPAGLLYAAWVWAVVLAICLFTWLITLLPLSRCTRWQLCRKAGGALRAATRTELHLPDGALELPGPAVLVPNHSSFVDGLVMMLAMEGPAVFVSSTDFERVPLVGGFLRRLGCVFVHRGRPEATRADVERLRQIVLQGGRLAVFSEGSMTRGRGVRPFHLGAFSVAAATGCPVVPIGIRGTAAIVPPGSFRPHRGVVEVRIGEPQQATGKDLGAAAQLAQRVRSMVAELSGQPELS